VSLKKINIHDLENIYNRENDYIIDGIKDSKNPYHFFTLATLNNITPQSRTIVLRDYDVNSKTISFNADYRSPKIKQLLKNKECAVLFYDNSRKIQIRFDCLATIFYNDTKSKQAWDKTQLQSRKCYMGVYTPSIVLDEYNPNIPIKYLKRDPDENDSHAGYKNFAFIKLQIQSSDILELHHDGHIRFKVDSNNKFSFIAI
tara:strand:+ start:267 stop:869 length:603 start_codon:yes stop_codon:yes gene_type:complete